MNGNAAVFLDRDGVLNPNFGYPHRREEAALFDDVVPALKELQGAGFLLLVVTNQSGVARGLFTLKEVQLFNQFLSEKLRSAGIHINSTNFYVCPHGPDDSCDCRKPKPGLLLKGAREHGIDLSKSASIGDTESDVEAGRSAGVFTVLLDREGSGHRTRADAIVSNLTEAANLLVHGRARVDSRSL